MEVLHCNGCGHLPHYSQQDPRRYFISSCGHIFCQNCVNRKFDSSCLQDSKESCIICKIKCRVLEISAQSKPEIKAYFMDPLTLLRESLKQTTQVLGFQKSQLSSFKTTVGRLVDAHKQALAEINKLKEDLEASKKETQECKSKMESMEQEHQNWIGSGLTNVGTAGSTPFSIRQLSGRSESTPINAFSNIFGTGDGSSFNARGMNTPIPRRSPFMMARNVDNRGGLFTPTPPSNADQNYGQLSSGGSIHYGPGRLTMPRTPTSEYNPDAESFTSPRVFSATPGAGRPSAIGQTPDIVARLRQLRCAASSSGSNVTPTSRA